MENKIEKYILKHPKWIDLLHQLRSLLLSEGLVETIKWGAPAYTFGGSNIVGMVAFKDYVCLWFYQGVFLKDPEKVLYNAQEGKTKALRQWRFESPTQVNQKIIQSYIKEAIENQKQGKVLKPEKGKALLIPDELQAALLSNQEVKKSFEELSLTKKREYTEYISEAKKTETKLKRIEKVIPMILKKKGLHDQYKK